MAALLGVPLLGLPFSGGPAFSSAAPFPDNCNDDEYLVAAQGTFVCKQLPPQMLSIPDCKPGTVLSAQGGVFTCQAQTTALSDSLMTTSAQYDQLEKDIAALPIGGTRTPFVGVTKLTTTADTGIAAANARCADEFPDARMCSVYDLYDTVIMGRLHAADRIPKSWIYFPAWNRPLPGAVNPDDGLADNCAGFTYGADDKGWSGMAGEWTVLPSGDAGFKFHGGSAAPCSAPLPIACCK
jgi:hypothetical protein